MKNRPYWLPDERQWVTLGLFLLTAMMLLMARENPKLWDVKLFEVILQAAVLTGLLNMVAAFHFAANKGSEVARENTGAAFRAIEATANASAPPALKVEPTAQVETKHNADGSTTQTITEARDG